MLHPDTELRYMNPDCGYAVIATRLIPKGTIVWVQDALDQVIDLNKSEALPAHLKAEVAKYSFRNNKGAYVLRWDNAKYINHSFHSNCMMTPYGFELTIEDILPEEELTEDHGFMNVPEARICAPQFGTNRTMVTPDDLVTYHRQWDIKLMDAFRHLLEAEQPLFPFLSSAIKENITAVANGEQKMESILNCYYANKGGTQG